MLSQGPLGFEGFHAYIADVVLLQIMRLHVLAEISTMSEAFCARIALEFVLKNSNLTLF